MTHADHIREPDDSDSTRDTGKRMRRTRSITAQDREQLRRLLDMYTEFFTSQREQGEIRSMDCEALGVILLSLLYAYVRVPMILGYADKVGSDTWNGLLADLLWHGLAPEARARLCGRCGLAGAPCLSRRAQWAARQA